MLGKLQWASFHWHEHHCLPQGQACVWRLHQVLKEAHSPIPIPLGISRKQNCTLASTPLNSLSSPRTGQELCAEESSDCMYKLFCSRRKQSSGTPSDKRSRTIPFNLTARNTRGEGKPLKNVTDDGLLAMGPTSSEWWQNASWKPCFWNEGRFNSLEVTWVP